EALVVLACANILPPTFALPLSDCHTFHEDTSSRSSVLLFLNRFLPPIFKSSISLFHTLALIVSALPSIIEPFLAIQLSTLLISTCNFPTSARTPTKIVLTLAHCSNC